MKLSNYLTHNQNIKPKQKAFYINKTLKRFFRYALQLKTDSNDRNYLQNFTKEVTHDATNTIINFNTYTYQNEQHQAIASPVPEFLQAELAKKEREEKLAKQKSPKQREQEFQLEQLRKQKEAAVKLKKLREEGNLIF